MNTVHSAESSPNNPIPKAREPFNVFKNQIEFKRSNENKVEHHTIFPNYLRYNIQYKDVKSAVGMIKHVIHPRNKNAIYFEPEEEHVLIPKIMETYPSVNFIITTNKVRDIIDPNEQKFIIINEHNRAHRGPNENVSQLNRQYFWPTMKKEILAHTSTCEICLKNKYERHPALQEIGETPIPKSVGDMLHMDIFFLENQKYLTCIDKFSKFLQLFHIRSNTEIPRLIEQILVIYPNCSNITTDNESVFISQNLNSLMRRYKITHHTTPLAHSITNAPVERVHSTILELSRTLSAQSGEDLTNVIFQAVREYNNTIHSVVREKPSDIFYHSDKYPETIELIRKAQIQTLKTHNKHRIKKNYKPGDTIYVKTDRRKKSVPRYKKYIVKENKRETIITTNNREIHKDTIRR